jgi:regulator of nonsense transcripts 3
MSTTATATQSPAKSKKEKEKDRREKAAQQQTTERLKTVVRRLPPNLPEEIFWQTVQRWVTDETATWKVYYGGKFKKRSDFCLYNWDEPWLTALNP